MANNESRSEIDFITTAIAIDRDKNSHHAVKWAIDNCLKGNSRVILVHVHQCMQPQGDVPKEGRAPTELELQQFFLPYRAICARKGVRAKEVVFQELDVANTLVDFINNNFISTLVVGASSRSALTKAFKNLDVPTVLGRSAPDFCSVYAISKAKVQNLKLASRPPTPSTSSSRQQSQTGFSSDTPGSEDFNGAFVQGSWRSGGSETTSFDRSSERITFERGSERISFESRELMQMTSQDRLPRNKIPSPQQSVTNLNLQVRTKGSPSCQDSGSDSSVFSGPSSFQSSNISFESLGHSRTSDVSRSSVSSQTSHALDDEIRRLNLELKQSMEMYNSACKDAMTVEEKERETETETDQCKSVEARQLEEAQQAHGAALALLEMEKQKSKAAMEVARMAQRLAELESQKRKCAEMKARREKAEKNKVLVALARFEIRYRKYSIEEIEMATNYFSSSEKIGEGGYGPVYKAFLDHTPVAIKVLGPDVSQGQKQFQREVEILSGMRHPNMVLLLGACPEYGCLVYEYMENGSLEDRLFRKNGTPSLSWKTRFRIAAEIATSILFLHQTKPEPLVHRDLKPDNILLDRNYVSKVSDVGLARLVPPSVADGVTQYQMTAAAGTFCYIDPEYQQTGMLGTKSDVYSFGIILLQIITAKPPIGLAHQIERSIERGTFSEMLDPTVTNWPFEEVLSYAKLAIQCCELRRKDRPDLGSVILPALNRLRNLGSDKFYGRSPRNSSSDIG